MPSLELARKLSSGVSSGGVARKLDADMLMKATWDEDIATRTAYFYDWYRDTHKEQLSNMTPQYDSYKTPISIKYIKHTSQTLDKDSVSFHIQFLPDQECTVPYYEDAMGRYGAKFPLGTYADIPDNKGIFHRWLVVAEADGNDTQFPTYEILKCDYVFRYIIDEFKFKEFLDFHPEFDRDKDESNPMQRIAGVKRSQNSYNQTVASYRNICRIIG